MDDKIIEFIRKKDYVLVKEIGQGACGKTVLLHDDVIHEHFVCKKYSPMYDEDKELLFKNFIQEIKLLHLLYHKNVVRVFNYYIYPDSYSGYIVMEYVQGSDIEDHLLMFPQNINDIFLQTIEGFWHLEENNILHRDIRPLNIMVTDNGTVKIIDLGFGKQISYESDFEKSISLNWWCTPPEEFKEKIYNFRTEIYFVGKLFEKIIIDHGIEQFKYFSILNKMCSRQPDNRPESFNNIRNEIQNEKFGEIEFTDDELWAYRSFSDNLFKIISKIKDGVKYKSDVDKLVFQLDHLYKNCMLEESIPDTSKLINCFINGNYRYFSKKTFSADTLKQFIQILKKNSKEKQNIILSNLQTKLDSIPRLYDFTPDSDVPF
jgi:serine/threonine protein kinase